MQMSDEMIELKHLIPIFKGIMFYWTVKFVYMLSLVVDIYTGFTQDYS